MQPREDALNLAGRHLEALPELERSLAITPGDPQVELDLAMAQLEAGKNLLRARELGAAEPLILAAGSRVPDLGNRELAAARQYHRDGDREQVIVHLQAAAILTPDDAPVYLDLALQLVAADRLDEALRSARHGAALVPDNERAQALVRELEQR